ncbi:MAG: HEAT repeat domain-containing protein, partial [Bacillota bacterium]|nr:HEAT repeat domain-containing protein [Bacillota bacterium]
MGLLNVWHRVALNFTSKEALIPQIEKKLIEGYSKISLQLKEELAYLSPLELAQLVNRIGDELSPLVRQSLKTYVTEQPIGEAWINMLVVERKVETKLTAIEAIGQLRLGQGAWPLVELLKNRNERLQMAAAKSLMALPTLPLIPGLIEGLRKKEFWLPARVAPVILTWPDTALPLLQDILVEEGLEEEVYQVAVEILSEAKKPKVNTFLAEIFMKHGAKIQTKILEVLCNLGAQEAEALAIKSLTSTSWQLRLQAINILNRLQVRSL